MGGDEGKKKSKKGLFAMILAAIGAVVMFKRKKGANADSGWEEAKPDVG